MSPTARRRTWYLALGAALAVQLVVLYVPRVPVVGAVGLPGADKVVHATVFGAVTLAGLRAGLSPALVLGLGAAHAPLSELLQHLVLPGRSGDPFDVVADLVGVALGALAARWLAGRGDGRPGRRTRPVGREDGRAGRARESRRVRGGARGRTGRDPSGPSR
jgi:hypothetical protein